MRVIMTSSIGGSIKENGKRMPAPLFWYNGFLEKLQSEWVNNSKVMIIAASPDDYEKNEEQYRVPAKLELTYKNENPITAGEKTKVWEHFYMDGADASKTSAKICAIFDEEGNRYSVITENGQDYIYIERAGIYQVYFRIIDEFYRIQYAVASIPVQVKKE